MNVLRIISRYAVGLVFIFSGVVKGIDPLGSAYKFHDYFHAFNIGFSDRLTLPLALFLCTAEFISGFSILSGLRYRTGILGTFILLLIFTPLTFILALTNPVTDCGCFGDALHLTNWQTFGKNVVLFIMLAIIIKSKNQVKNIFRTRTEWGSMLFVIFLFIVFSLSNLKYLPLIDFLPYKKGVKIGDKMSIPENLTPDQYQTTFIYEKGGVKKEFDLNNYPANDSGWKFIEQRSVLIKSGYKPPIHDFILTSLYGEDITDKILSHKGFSLLMITKKISEARQDYLSEGYNIGRFCRENGIAFYVLTASGTEEARSIDTEASVLLADETTLKTMVRANPGYVLLKDGVIIEKWSWANIPDFKWFNKLITESMKYEER